jgi:hypothetical protein
MVTHDELGRMSPPENKPDGEHLRMVATRLADTIYQHILWRESPKSDGGEGEQRPPLARS